MSRVQTMATVLAVDVAGKGGVGFNAAARQIAEMLLDGEGTSWSRGGHKEKLSAFRRGGEILRLKMEDFAEKKGDVRTP